MLLIGGDFKPSHNRQLFLVRLANVSGLASTEPSPAAK